jgi:hypothetical protein
VLGGTIGVFIPAAREAPIVSSPSIATILRDHVSLSISCVDRLYLNGHVPLLQAPGHRAGPARGVRLFARRG